MRIAERGIPTIEEKPRDDEIDVFGLSHTGRVRAVNQDHFLLAAIHKRVQVLQSNLPSSHHLPIGEQRLAMIAMIADGVGGGESGEEASATALEVAMEYLANSTDCYLRNESDDEQLMHALQDAATKCHEAVVERSKALPDGRMATTLTLWMGVWPWYYLLQVGDSRYYLFRDDVLTQVTRDQTIAQDLLDQGVFTRAMATRSHFSNVLSSAIGGDTALPVVTRMRADWMNVHLLCTDGLTKHVSDERIADRLRNMTSAKQCAEQLLEDALEGGGSDNVAIIVGRAIRRSPG
jgi:serine/threonine protein phosphatase PrpC